MFAPAPFSTLRMFGYHGLHIDVPWSYEMRTEAGYDRSPEAHYETMPDDQVLDLPVGHLASSHCTIFMWAVWPKLPLAQACLARWGFKHITGGSWVKMTKDGKKPHMGTGYVMRSACEPFLIGRIGPPLKTLTDFPNVILAPKREHSRKPEDGRRFLERITPNGFCADLFARAPWPGHDVWGNETTKFQVPT